MNESPMRKAECERLLNEAMCRPGCSERMFANPVIHTRLLSDGHEVVTSLSWLYVRRYPGRWVLDTLPRGDALSQIQIPVVQKRTTKRMLTHDGMRQVLDCPEWCADSLVGQYGYWFFIPLDVERPWEVGTTPENHPGHAFRLFRMIERAAEVTA